MPGLRRSLEAVASTRAKFDLSVSLLERRWPGRRGGGDRRRAGVFQRAVRSRQRCGAGRAADPSAGRRGGGAGSADRAACAAVGAPSARTLLSLWNATAQPVAASTLPELFAAQAARTPAAVAVVFEDRDAELRRTGGARQPAGAPSARLWGSGRRPWSGFAWSARRRW